MILSSGNGDIRWAGAGAGALRLRCSSLKPRLTTFITAFPSKIKRLRKLSEKRRINRIIQIPLDLVLLTHHGIWFNYALKRLA